VVIEPAWIVGVGMTRFGVRQDFSGNDLTRDAVTIALRDAGAELGDIDAAYFGNTAHGLLEGRHVATGQIALRSMGFERIPIVNVENDCATGATALHQAALHVRAGAADVVIAVGVDKTSVDGKQSLLVPFNFRVDVHDAAVQAVTHKPRDYAETGGAACSRVTTPTCYAPTSGPLEPRSTSLPPFRRRIGRTPCTIHSPITAKRSRLTKSSLPDRSSNLSQCRCARL